MSYELNLSVTADALALANQCVEAFKTRTNKKGPGKLRPAVAIRRAKDDIIVLNPRLSVWGPHPDNSSDVVYRIQVDSIIDVYNAGDRAKPDWKETKSTIFTVLKDETVNMWSNWEIYELPDGSSAPDNLRVVGKIKL